jgi:hypothetical protein
MDLEEIDVWGLKTCEGRVDCVEDRSTRQARLIDVLGLIFYAWYGERLDGGIIGDETVALCGNDDLVARDIVLWDSCVKR